MRNIWTYFFVGLGSVSSAVALVPTEWNGVDYDCKCYLGDDCWPSDNAWSQLNETVGGNLLLNIPPGAACYTEFDGPLGTLSTYNEEECAEATANLENQQWTATENPDDVCTLGYYGLYVIMAKDKSHIKAGIDFARENNLRLVIRNTGHDFIGRSVGWGSLIINTHSFRDVTFTDEWTGPGDYSGGAVTIGAGVQARSLLTQAFEQDPPVAVITGECPMMVSTGTNFTVAADSALSFDVITAAGEYLTANEESNPDLFWALKGGGPGTFAAVLSVTLKTYPEVKSSGVTLHINSTTHTNDTDVFWAGVTSFHKYANHFVDSGLYGYFEISALRLYVQPLVGVDKTAAEMDEIAKPMLDELDEKNIPYSTTTREFNTLYELYINLFDDEGADIHALTGGWMFPHEDVANNNDAIVEAFKLIVSPREDLVDQGTVIGHLWNPGYGMPTPNSATNPIFRNATDFAINTLPVPVGATWEQKQDMQNLLTNVTDAAMREAGPNGCTYVNEADPFQPNWQDVFWGTAYPTLLETKMKWDPEGVFYTVSTPGAEEWEVIDYGTRLCKRAS